MPSSTKRNVTPSQPNTKKTSTTAKSLQVPVNSTTSTGNSTNTTTSAITTDVIIATLKVAIATFVRIIQTTYIYYYYFYYYGWGFGRYGPYDTKLPSPSPTTGTADKDGKNKDDQKHKLLQQHVRIHLFSLTSNFYLYKRPHYRKGTYQTDLIDNLQNVAIPGTGVPLSYIVYWNEYIVMMFLLFWYPLLSLIAAIHLYISSKYQSDLHEEYYIRLLAPNDWFHYWRLNCSIVGLHSYLNNMPMDYEMENKWTFLQIGYDKQVPVSPYYRDEISSHIVIKHKNEEGGLGIYFYDNAVHGGDYIIQERLYNSTWVNQLLPEKAPLSTFRIITCSKCGIRDPFIQSQKELKQQQKLKQKNKDTSDDNTTTKTTIQHDRKDIQSLSCVFRAGRQNALTDHSSILFDVDIQTGTLLGGTTNMHWYQLGWMNTILKKCPWRSYDEQRIQTHPDGGDPDSATTKSNEKKPIIQVTGQTIPNFQELLTLVEDSHYQLCPSVPMAGWDVVLSSNPKVPICLLEVNLSCNFFRGTFDEKVYYDFVDEVFTKLQEQRIQADKEEEAEKAVLQSASGTASSNSQAKKSQ